MTPKEELVKRVGEENLDKRGKSSFSLKRINNYETKEECIKRFFDLDNDFSKYYIEACSGDGKEEPEIDTVWSSALLPLVFFYSSVKQNKGIILPIDELKDEMFTECFFEFKNPTLNGERPCSNMDCVLLNETKTKIVFIESKFFEYAYGCSTLEKGKILKDEYKNNPYTKELYNEFYSIDTKDKSRYLEGIKQLITHYSGLINFVDGKSSDKRPEIADFRKPFDEALSSSNVYFVEVIYDLTGTSSEYRKNDYELLSKDFCKNIRIEEQKRMNDKPNSKQIHILDLITYQEIYNYKDNSNKINKKIADFYGLSKKNNFVKKRQSRMLFFYLYY